MKTKMRGFLCILLVFLFISGLLPAALGAAELPTVKVAMSEDESIIVERILYTALKRAGYQMVTKTAGMRTTVNDVNYGDAAIVPAQTSGLDVDYPNLIKVPVPISYVETNAYTRSEGPYQFSSWSDLKGLRLSHCWKNLYITRNVPRAEASQVVTLSEYEDLWASLLAKETDVAVIPNLTGFVRIVPSGVKLAGVIEREPRYTYVNKDYAYLVPLLTEAYSEMTDDGTMELIRGSNQSGDTHVVLHISSYSAQVEWERQEIDAIRNSLDMNQKFVYHNLNLNSRQAHNRANINSNIANTIRADYIERNPDLIIVSDNDALEFVLNNYFMLFPKTPVVFCGVNDFDPAMLHGFEEYVTGIAEYMPFSETIEEMLRMYPNTERVYILNDYTHSGTILADNIRKTISEMNSTVDFEFNENKPVSEILDDIRGFDDNTLVLLGTYFLDGGGVFYSEREVQEMVCAASNMPVFCLADSFNGNGTLGGMVSSGEVHGRTAGTIGNEILKGKSPSEIPIITDSSEFNLWQFDYAVAERFGVNTKNLPTGHKIVNRSMPIWETNPLEFNAAIVAVIVFLLIIAGLMTFLRLMRKKNAHLVEMQRHLHSAEELIEKDNGLRKMIDSLPIAVMIADIGTCRLEYGNQAFLTASGFKTFQDALGLDLSPLVKKAFSMWSGKAVSFNYGSLQNPDSDARQKISAERLVYNNKQCFVLISEDITAQLKETEMLASAAQKEKEANMLKSMFLANMSHEIRTPMNAIIGLSQLALIKSQTPENENYFSKISSSAKNLLSIINDILDFSKIEAEKLDLVEEEFELEDAISNAFIVTADRVENKPVEILLDINPCVPCFLYGDSTRLWQVLKNVLDNAVKYTSAGHVLLSVDAAYDGSDNVSIRFRIEDTGVGMSPSQLEHLFTPFEQLHQNDFKNKKAGTGLGMSITKQLVALMRGSIEVQSISGGGSVFTITIPFRLSPHAGTIHDTCLDYVKNTTRKTSPVLLADSDELSLRVMRSLLGDIGIETEVARNTAEALALIERCDESGLAFQTAVISYSLDNGNGIDAAKNIKLRTGARVILAAAFAMRVAAAQMLGDSGIDDIIEKPFVASDFIQRITGAKPDFIQTQNEYPKYSKARVLLCEDNEINQDVAAGMLSEFGITPMIVSNGREALELLESHTFDLIFMDIIMPVMDGHEATIAIRQSGKHYANTPICALTANVMVDEVQRCMSEGVTAHLEKPLDINALCGVLSAVLGNMRE